MNLLHTKARFLVEDVKGLFPCPHEDCYYDESSGNNVYDDETDAGEFINKVRCHYRHD